MVAYSFKKEFVPLIRNGTKKHTIRAIGKRRHARVGELLQLYCGQRTPQCFKILDGDPECIRTALIDINADGIAINSIRLRADEMTQLAKNDGFKTLGELIDFFEPRMPFQGVLIEWGTPEW